MTSSSLPIVTAVGGSAGGLEAFKTFLISLGNEPGTAIVWVQHRDPNSEDPNSEPLLPELLATATTMNVVEIKDGCELEINTVYVCPPRTMLSTKRGVICTSPIDNSDNQAVTPIDQFFHSLATQHGESAIGVILSGSGSDGTLGLKAISDQGGLTFAQDSASAKFDSMPRSAATTGVADHVLPPCEIATEILRYLRHIRDAGETDSRVDLPTEIREAIPLIAQRLADVTQHNFTHYKPNTLTRRIRRRMQLLKIARASDYVSQLRKDETEVLALFRELLIGVTAFFRDPDAFEFLRSSVLTKLFENRPPDDCVRIWVAGCASGQEAYTVAILCREIMDELESREGSAVCEVQIFATDIDQRALQVGREGIYPAGIADQVGPERLKRFFVKRGKQYHVAKCIRDLVLFSEHNLISDPPFSRQDLICCRNLLIYLGPHLQKKLIPLFHYALRPSGFLLLGPSENITSHGELFRLINTQHRISQRKGTAVGSSGASQYRPGTNGTTPGEPPRPDTGIDLTELRQRITLDEFAPKSVIIDEEGKILNASPEMQKYLTVSGGDYENNITKMAARGLRIGLRVAIAEAKRIRRRVQHENLSIRVDDKTQRILLTVQPMPRLGENESLFMVVFQDVGLPVRRDGGEDSAALTAGGQNEEAIVMQLERELETTRDDLDRTLQDMEASNEELKSSNEELLSMNEELQSANEELETSKEEIRSGSEAVARANDDLENLLRSTQIATVFLDDELRIRSFTPAIADIYDLIATDIGRPLQKFVPSAAKMPPLPDPRSIRDGDIVEDTILSDSGRSYIRRVLPYRSHTGHNEGIVVTFTDVSQLTESRELFELLIKASAQIVWVTDANGHVTDDSPSWREFTGQTFDQWVGHGWMEVIHPDDREATMTSWKAKVVTGQPLSIQYRLRHRSGEYRWTQVNAVPQRNSDGSIKRWIGMNTDIDDQKRIEVEIADREAHLRRVIDNTLNFVGVLSPDGTLLEANATALQAGGITRDDVIGKPFWECSWWSYDQASVDQLRESIEQARNGELIRHDVQIRTANDTRTVIDFMLVPVKNSAGEVTHLIPSGVDISNRIMVEQSLIDNERRVTMALEAGNMAAWEWTPQKSFWEPKLFELLGLPPTDNPDPDLFFKVVHPDDLPSLQAVWQRATVGQDEYRTEFRVIRSDGQTRWLAAAGTVTRSDDGSVAAMHGLNWDITDRKESENRIRASEERLRLALQAAELQLWQWSVNEDEWLSSVDDAATGDWDGLQKIGGLVDFLDQVHPNDRKRVETSLRTSLENEQPYREEYRVRRADDFRWMMAMAHPSVGDANSPLQLIGVELDITHRRGIERQAHDQTKRLAMALKAGEMAAWEWAPGGSVWTDSLYELLAVPKDQPANPDLFFAKVHSEDLPDLQAAWQASLDTGSDFEHEFRYLRPDGEIRWMVGVGEAIRNRNGDVVRFYGLNWDSTDEHITAQRLRESEQAALAASESKSAFVANMSHEIRTPMTSILGYADLLQDFVDHPEAIGHLQTIQRNGDFLLNIINDILDLSKIEAGKLDIEYERFQPAQLIEDVRSVMSVRAREGGLSLDVEYDGKLPKLIESDAKRLKQILINLVGNAIKFTQQGRVKIRVRFEHDRHQLHFDIVDTGIGMSNKQQEKLFKPFSQGDVSITRHFGGTGLGLAISKRIAEILGGKIAASSTEGVGSTFTVTVPTGKLDGVEFVDYAAALDPDAIVSPPKSQKNVALRCHVLVVDDRRDIRFLSRRLLNKAGATVDECEDGQQAVEHMTACLSTSDCPDLILLDMQMPNLDGYQTARSLRKLGYEGPIIALTADAMQGDMNECIEAGCNDYLSKPIDAIRMVELVAELTATEET